jgi:hypothetical protein
MVAVNNCYKVWYILSSSIIIYEWGVFWIFPQFFLTRSLPYFFRRKCHSLHLRNWNVSIFSTFSLFLDEMLYWKRLKVYIFTSCTCLQDPSTFAPQNNPPCPTLFVANLGPACSEQELIDVFSRYRQYYASWGVIKTFIIYFLTSLFSWLVARDLWSWRCKTSLETQLHLLISWYKCLYSCVPDYHFILCSMNQWCGLSCHLFLICSHTLIVCFLIYDLWYTYRVHVI